MNTVYKKNLRFKCENLIESLDLNSLDTKSKIEELIYIEAKNFYIDNAKHFGFNESDLNKKRSISNQLEESKLTFKTIATIIAAIFGLYESAKEIDRKVIILLSKIEIPKELPNNKQALKESKKFIENTINQCIQIKRFFTNTIHSDQPNIKINVITQIETDLLGNSTQKSKWQIQLLEIEKEILKGAASSKIESEDAKQIKTNQVNVITENVTIEPKSTNENLETNHHRKINLPLEFTDNQYFGREEEKNKIKDFFKNPKECFLLIHGLGGVGKTNLVYIVKKELEIENEIYIDCKKDYEYTLPDIARKLKLDVEIDSTHSILSDKICEFIREVHSPIIIDNFHNVIDKNTRDILSELSVLKKGKVILISRDFPSEIMTNLEVREKSIFVNFLSFEHFKSYINEISGNKLSEADILTIYNKTNGFPYIAKLILTGLEMLLPLEQMLKNLTIYDSELSSKDQSNTNILLNFIFEKGEPEEIEQFATLSALVEPVGIDIISKLPNFNLSALNKLLKKRSFISIVADKYVMQDIIKEFAYANIKDKEILHQGIASVYIELFKLIEEFDLALSKETLHHITISQDEGLLEQFRVDFKEKFGTSKTKSFLNQSLESNVTIYETLLELNPENVKYISQLSYHYRQNGLWEKGLKLLEDSLKKPQFKDELYLLLELSKYHIFYNDVQQAEIILLRINEMDKECVHSRHELGKLYTQMEKYQDAAKQFEEVVEINPFDVSSRNELGKLYTQIERYQDAVKQFLEVIEINPVNVNARAELGKLYLQLEKYDKAEQTFLEAIQIDENHVYPRTELGRLYVQLEDYGKAEQQFLDVIRIQPDNVYSRNELGRLYVQLAKYDIAEQQFLDVIRIQPDNIHSRNDLGRLYIQLEKYYKAEKLFLESNQIDTESVHSRVELGRLYIKNERYNEAEQQLIDIVSIDVKNTFASNELGKLYFIQNKIRKSILIVENCLKYTENGSNFFLISKQLYNYLKVKDQFSYEQLFQYTEKLLEENPNNENSRHVKQFKKFIASGKTLISLYEVGIIENVNGKLNIKDIKEIQFWNRITHSENLSHGLKVYYATYNLSNGKTVIDFVEPYFELKDSLVR